VILSSLWPPRHRWSSFFFFGIAWILRWSLTIHLKETASCSSYLFHTCTSLLWRHEYTCPILSVFDFIDETVHIAEANVTATYAITLAMAWMPGQKWRQGDVILLVPAGTSTGLGHD
jgi:hypothetical protein